MREHEQESANRNQTSDFRQGSAPARLDTALAAVRGGGRLTPQMILAVQRSAGNAAVGRLLAGRRQAKGHTENVAKAETDGAADAALVQADRPLTTSPMGEDGSTARRDFRREPPKVQALVVQRVPINIRHNGQLVSIEPLTLVQQIIGRMQAGVGVSGFTFLQEIEEVLVQVVASLMPGHGAVGANAVIKDHNVYPPIQFQLHQLATTGSYANRRAYSTILDRMYQWFNVQRAQAVAAPTLAHHGEANQMRQPNAVQVAVNHIDTRHFYDTFFLNPLVNMRPVNGFFPLAWTMLNAQAQIDAILASDECRDALAYALANNLSWTSVQVSDAAGYLYYLAGSVLPPPAMGQPRSFRVDQFYLRRGAPTFAPADITACDQHARLSGAVGTAHYLNAVRTWLQNNGQP